jgi:hypothetical protein
MIWPPFLLESGTGTIFNKTNQRYLEYKDVIAATVIS